MYVVNRHWANSDKVLYQVTSEALVDCISSFVQTYGSSGFRSIISFNRIEVYDAGDDGFVSSISWNLE